MSLRVVILAKAEQDLWSNVAWLARRSRQGAARWLAAFESAKERLAVNPSSFALAPENARVSFELRQILFRTPRGRQYRAVFTVVDDEVRILRIRGPGQPLLPKRELPKGQPPSRE